MPLRVFKGKPRFKGKGPPSRLIKAARELTWAANMVNPTRRQQGGTLTGFKKDKIVLFNDKPQIQRGPLPFAREFMVRIPYSDFYQQNAPTTTGLIGVATWSLNSLHDCDITGAGHQPMQYDQLTGIYKRYMVHKCKVELEFSNPTGDDLVVGYCVRNENLSGASGSTLASMGERRNVQIAPLVNTGIQRKSYAFTVDLAKAFAQPKMLFKAQDTLYGAAVGSSPTKFCYLETITAAPLGQTTGCNVRIRLTYFARMYDYQTQSQS